jgi:hypothetical protein
MKTKSHSSAPLSGASKLDAQKTILHAAERGAARLKEAQDESIGVATHSLQAMQDAYGPTAKSVTDYSEKVLEYARANTNAFFGFAAKLLAVKSPSEFWDVSNAHTRQQSEILTTQHRELTDIGQKAMLRVAEPFTAGLKKATNPS